MINKRLLNPQSLETTRARLDSARKIVEGYESRVNPYLSDSYESETSHKLLSIFRKEITQKEALLKG